MARRTVPSIHQAEVPGTEGPGRIPELHALGLELKDIQDRSMEWRKKDTEKRKEVAAKLTELGLDDYDCDGVSVWREKGADRVKVSVKVPEEIP